jgi:hypothetical protein
MTKIYQSYDTFCVFNSKEDLEAFLATTSGFRDTGLNAFGVWISHQDIMNAVSLGGVIIV